MGGPPPPPPPPPPGPAPKPSSRTPRIFAEVDQALKRLARANIAFNVPTKVELGETAQIQLRLSPKLTIHQLRETITAVGRREGAPVRVSQEMEARLSGFGFSIAAITSERQPVSGSGVTTWLWDIEATKTGTRHLHLTLTAFISLKRGESPRPVATFDRTLTIDVTWYHRLSGFVSHNWQWLWAAILTPLAGLLAGLWKARRSPRASMNGASASPPNP
jgi:hypothetical protein